MDFGLFDDRPPSVRRFAEILRTSPLVVIASDERVTIRAVQLAPTGRLVESYAWPRKNWAAWCEACDLFWGDNDVWAWICAHPYAEEGIHYKNVAATCRAAGMPVIEIAGPVAPESTEKPKAEL